MDGGIEGWQQPERLPLMQASIMKESFACMARRVVTRSFEGAPLDKLGAFVHFWNSMSSSLRTSLAQDVTKEQGEKILQALNSDFHMLEETLDTLQTYLNTHFNEVSGMELSENTKLSAAGNSLKLAREAFGLLIRSYNDPAALVEGLEALEVALEGYIRTVSEQIALSGLTEKGRQDFGTVLLTAKDAEKIQGAGHLNDTHVTQAYRMGESILRALADVDPDITFAKSPVRSQIYVFIKQCNGTIERLTSHIEVCKAAYHRKLQQISAARTDGALKALQRQAEELQAEITACRDARTHLISFAEEVQAEVLRVFPDFFDADRQRLAADIQAAFQELQSSNLIPIKQAAQDGDRAGFSACWEDLLEQSPAFRRLVDAQGEEAVRQVLAQLGLDPDAVWGPLNLGEIN